MVILFPNLFWLTLRKNVPVIEKRFMYSISGMQEQSLKQNTYLFQVPGGFSDLIHCTYIKTIKLEKNNCYLVTCMKSQKISRSRYKLTLSISLQVVQICFLSTNLSLYYMLCIKLKAVVECTIVHIFCFKITPRLHQPM